MKTVKILYLLTFVITLHGNAQNLNTEISPNGQSPYLLGKIDKSGLEGENYSSWFTKNYDNYQLNEKIIAQISSNLKSYSIKLFMGTWCGDSKKEVPRLYRVLEATGFSMEQLTVVAVSRKADMYKQSPQHEEAGLNIHRVPTVIFYKNEKEVNRIVEHPVQSFEEDIQKIITTNNYKSNYIIVTEVDNILSLKGVKGFKKKAKKMLSKFDGKVSSMFELNTYARILFGTGKIEEAIATYEFNTKLFPEEPRTYMSLANTLGLSGDKEKATKVLENAIKQFPENKDLKENLEKIKSN